MEIRLAVHEDLPHIETIYQRARSFMGDTGNPHQWGTENPKRCVLEADIVASRLFVVEEDQKIFGVFAFIMGEDPTYQVIDGRWNSSVPYGTIHRIASSGEKRGIFLACIGFCERKTGYLRIDTHEDNRIMQHLIEKHGFRRCGIITLADGSSRIAYDRI